MLNPGHTAGTRPTETFPEFSLVNRLMLLTSRFNNIIKAGLSALWYEVLAAVAAVACGDRDVAAGAALADADLGRDALAKLGDVADDPTIRPPARRPSRTFMTSSRVSSSRVPKPSSTNRASIRVPADSAVTTSARPRASARLARNVSPPDSVAVSRSIPVQASQASRTGRLGVALPRVRVDQGVAARRHREQALAGRRGDLFQPGRQDEAGQGHLVLVRAAGAVGQVGQVADLAARSCRGARRRGRVEARPEPG